MTLRNFYGTLYGNLVTMTTYDSSLTECSITVYIKIFSHLRTGFSSCLCLSCLLTKYLSFTPIEGWYFYHGSLQLDW